MTTIRFISVTAAGVLAWITRARRSPERDLIELLIASDSDQGTDLHALARGLGCSFAELGRTLFALNRQGCLGIGPRARPRQRAGACTAHSSLRQSLQLLAGDAQAALLADRQGLCIAAVGLSVNRASRIAARGCFAHDSRVESAVLHFMDETVTVLSERGVSPLNPAWPDLVRCLLPSCGAMGPVGGGGR